MNERPGGKMAASQVGSLSGYLIFSGHLSPGDLRALIPATEKHPLLVTRTDTALHMVLTHVKAQADKVRPDSHVPLARRRSEARPDE